MLINDANFSDALSKLRKSKTIFLDTETTGLQWHQGKKPFSIILADQDCEPFYFNLFSYDNTQYVVSVKMLEALQEALFSDALRRVVAHNLKFDWHMLANIGFHINSQVYDTQAMHRLANNKLMSYTLASLTGQKDDAANAWLKKNKKIGYVTDKWGEEQPAYWRIPFEIIVPYATQDVVALRNLYNWQQATFSEMWANEFPAAYYIEMKATRTIWEAERRGILLDVQYTLDAREAELVKAKIARNEFTKMTGEEFNDSELSIPRIFASYGITLPKGKPSPKLKKQKFKTDEDTLLATRHPLAEVILRIRKAEKKVSTYFDNYLTLRNQNTGAIHTDFRQCGADTLRMSASAPNAQNVPDESEDDPQPKFPLRGCFVPRDGHKLISIDFAAQEMRVIIDAAGEESLAAKIIGGEDVHQATADMMGVKRRPAKNIGFGIIYGSGAAKIASQINSTVEEARRLRELYFSKLPMVRQISRALVRIAEETGCILTRFGNRLFIDQGFEYRAVNYFVQGSSAMHTKHAANNVRDFLVPHKSKILLLIHDELVIELHDSEHHLIPEIRKRMADSYPHKILPQDTGVEVYKYRWGGEAM